MFMDVFEKCPKKLHYAYTTQKGLCYNRLEHHLSFTYTSNQVLGGRFMNLFDRIPYNLFSVFAGESRRHYADALFLIYRKMSGTSFMITRETIIGHLSEHFEDVSTDTFDHEEARSAKDKASAVLRRLRETGWVREEVGKNYETLIYLEDYASAILETLTNIDQTKQIEYSGYIHTIHTLVEKLDEENASLSIEQIHTNTVKLVNSLKTLNANIKKYIERLIKRKESDDLESIMKILLEDYQEKIVNRAYYNLKTIDNPSRYRNDILNRLHDLYDKDNFLETTTAQFAARKDMSPDEASDTVEAMIGDVIESFEMLDSMMGEIDYKNARYVKTAVSRMTYLYQNKKDLEGKVYALINHIDTSYDKDDVIDLVSFNLDALSNLDPEGLYKKPLKSTFSLSSLSEEEETDLDLIEKEAELLMKESAFSVRAINLYVEEILGNGKQKKASLFPLESNLDYIRLILIYLYATSEQSSYAITPLNVRVQIKNLDFEDFIIKKKEADHEPIQ